MHIHTNSCQVVPTYIIDDLAFLNDEIQTIESSSNSSKTNRKIHLPSIKSFFHGVKTRTANVAYGLHSLTPFGRKAAVAAEMHTPDFFDPIDMHHFRIFDANHQSLLSQDNAPLRNVGTLLSSSTFDEWPSNAQNAFYGAQKVCQFYETVFSLQLFDDPDTKIDSYVNVYEWHENPEGSRQYAIRPMSNANWDGSRMAYGEGDGLIFGDFTDSLEIVGHELTHRVAKSAYGFQIADYYDQPGAINEHLADVLGTIFAQRERDETDPVKANWLIGEGLVKRDFRKMLREKGLGHYDALRSMKEPGTAYLLTKDGETRRDPQPSSMLDYNTTPDDHGGVHINSGILNRAFYLFATAIGGPAWDTPGQLWYKTMTSGKINSQTDFRRFAEATLKIAAKKLPSSEQTALRKAWTDVHVIQ